MATRSMQNVLDLAEVRELAQSGQARRIRLHAGLSLAEVAGALGIDPSTLSRWETGQRRPLGRAALAYARLLARLTEAADAK